MINKMKNIGLIKMTKFRFAFTLVELLVVVSIIALLISILLPSLKSAREQAKTLKCQANLSGISKAAIVYQAEFDEWLVGSPGTTGSLIYGKYQGQDSGYVDMPEAPLQIWDFTGPLAVHSMSMEGLPAKRSERWDELLGAGIFKCPSNKVKSEVYPRGTAEFKNGNGSSYCTVRNFTVWPRSSAFGGTVPFDVEYGAGNNAARMRVGGTTNIPSSYSPRVSKVGQPSEKVFFADGSRYTDVDQQTGAPTVTHNVQWDGAYGGAFSTAGPTVGEQYLRAYWLDDPARKFTYRHGKGKTVGIVISFFDGHAEWVSEDKSRDVSYWYPKGSTIPPNDMNRATIRKYPRTAFEGPGNTYRVPN